MPNICEHEWHSKKTIVQTQESTVNQESTVDQECVAMSPFLKLCIPLHGLTTTVLIISSGIFP